MFLFEDNSSLTILVDQALLKKNLNVKNGLIQMEMKCCHSFQSMYSPSSDAVPGLRHWKCTASSTTYSKKSCEVLAWVMTACWVQHSGLIFI